MAGRFQADLDACSTMQGNCEAPLNLDSSQSRRASQFADELREVLGDDSEPDPLFFEESWSIGLPTALANWCQRQQLQVDRESEGRALQQLDNVGSHVFVQCSGWNMDHFLAAHASAIAGRDDISGPSRSHEESAARTKYQRMNEQPPPLSDCNGTQKTINSMTVPSAYHVLGVTRTCTREQARVAYRRLVGVWHPDRVERESQEVRRRANEQMSAINEAYRLLLIGLIGEPRCAETV